ncbi:MAG: tetratricopeptide repeat protein [Rhodothermales bacterium]|nr:tetratricopeptide repeat protein [Rhodothermales bacterium]
MPEPAPASAAAPLSARRRLVFTGVMLLIPVGFFVLLEAGLRVGGYGADYPLFEPVPGHPDLRVQSREVARRYFAQQADVPSALHDVFPAERAENELRLFVQGGSTAAGFPFYHGGAFSRMLEWRLRQTLDRPVEVVNTAMAAVNSYTLLDLADEIVEQEPDAVLVYAGHNEYYGALGVGSTESLGRFRGLVTLYLKLRRLRTVQLLRDALAGAAGVLASSDGEGREGTLMARMVGEQTIPFGSAEYELGLRQFRDNLSDLLATYERAGIPVLVATIASNERALRPFVTVHAPGTDEAAWRERYEAGVEALRRGDANAAVRALEEAVALDTLAADGYFALGRAYEAAGDTAAAAEAYAAARDRDALRFRAPSAFNRIIRAEAAEHGATVVEVEAAMREASPGGVIGEAMMLEHLHPPIDGYFVIADAFYDALRTAGLFRPDRDVPPAVARRQIPLTPADSLVGVLRVRRLKSDWPFVPRDAARVRADTLTVRTEFDRIVKALYEAETPWVEAQQELAVYYERGGDERRAVQALDAVIAAYPMLPQAYLQLAGIHLRAGRLDAAERNYRAVLEREPRSAEAQKWLGAVLLVLGALDEAVTRLETARRLAPRDPQALYNLAGAYALSQRFAEAREAAQALLQVQPDHQPGRQLLASLPPSN